ncbi:hypothetical protein [Lentimicrobium sp. S6]|uniref:hypothetical protein n=1 Tax=Lentimicrobium sp. S6 TaxID=2735872 RepID=UPI001557167B|nr:hypothetical protein [Lentimicrobium sp. S6]NPD47703.1 hypothetical protein [Lentimicrobium sp. S6]
MQQKTALILLVLTGLFLVNFSHAGNKKSTISNGKIESVIKSIQEKQSNADAFLLKKGVVQVARLWRESDGSAEEFQSFCEENYVANPEERKQLFLRFDRHYEVLWGNLLKLQLELNEPNHMDIGELTDVDMMFAAYNPQAHLAEDLFANKIAFVTALNFPELSLDEKNDLGKDWDSLDWAYARIGDVFTSRIPASLLQARSNAATTSDAYISEYNIFMGHVIGKDGKKHFPEDMKLITHWNLRDELKSNYSTENGQYKQEMIYLVMKRIIDQSIPQAVINSPEYDWDIINNTISKKGKNVTSESEPDTRYQQLLNNFLTTKALDEYYPAYPTYVERRFSGNMEIPQEEVERIFIDLVSSEEVKDLAKLIKKQLGRDLRPYDIWYNGFKAQSSLSEAELNEITQEKYTNPKAFEADMPRMLQDLKFSEEQANFLASKIQVDGSRGAGHAWGAEMKAEKARLRTRIGAEGMNYKGYNIAVHEFGHNVEQTITLHDVDYYMLRGVPNTAFTEALAFIFQKRDLELLGLEEKNAAKVHYMALANLWSCYEIMGVSLVDMAVWEWMYANPNATAAELKVAVIDIAKEVWNKYFAEKFGVKDEPILAIYSHMIDNPLYLSAYPIGQLIDFQIEQQIEGKVFADEINRIYSVGRLTPKYWMENAVGKELSTKPLLKASRGALEFLK